MRSSHTTGISRRWRRGVSLCLLLALSPALSAAKASDGRAPGADEVTTGLTELHRGLYSRAERRFRTLAAAAPGDPAPLFLVSFSRWWSLLLERPKGSYEDEVFDQMIEAAIAEGRRKIEEDPDDYRSMAVVGGAHILRAHVEALRRNFFRGAREAGRGKKLLEAALEYDPSFEVALFPLGAFNYYADNVPLIVKGLRFLLFLPGGDRDRGLQQIRTVAESESPFRLDARLLLSEICSSDDERSYLDAIEHLDRAIVVSPDSPVVLAASGRLHNRLAYYEAAEELFKRALAAAYDDAPERTRQRLRLHLAIAEAAIAGWRLDRGEEHLRQVPLEGREMSPSLLAARARLQRELDDKRSGDPWVRNFGEGLRRFHEEQYAGALDSFAAARQAADSSPSWFEGGIALYSGIAERHLGNDRRAKEWLRRAAGVRRFRSADRARLELRGEAPENPGCAP